MLAVAEAELESAKQAVTLAEAQLEAAQLAMQFAIAKVKTMKAQGDKLKGRAEQPSDASTPPAGQSRSHVGRQSFLHNGSLDSLPSAFLNVGPGGVAKPTEDDGKSFVRIKSGGGLSALGASSFAVRGGCSPSGGSSPHSSGTSPSSSFTKRTMNSVFNLRTKVLPSKATRAAAASAHNANGCTSVFAAAGVPSSARPEGRRRRGSFDDAFAQPDEEVLPPVRHSRKQSLDGVYDPSRIQNGMEGGHKQGRQSELSAEMHQAKINEMRNKVQRHTIEGGVVVRRKPGEDPPIPNPSEQEGGGCNVQ